MKSQTFINNILLKRYMFATEREIVKFIINNSWVIEDGLTFLGEEIRTGSDESGRIDLLFKNDRNKFWVLEIKKGTINSSAVSQLVKYVGAVAEKNRLSKEDIRMVLVGNKVTAEVREFCSLFGIRLIELGLVDELKDKVEGYLSNIDKFQGTESPKNSPKAEELRAKYRIIRIRTIPAIASGSIIEMSPNELIFSLFTPKRVQLINELIQNRHSSIRELAFSLNRDIKNVFDDLMLLQDADIVTMTRDGNRNVPTIKKKSLIIKLG